MRNPTLFVALLITLALAIGGAVLEDSAGNLREAGERLEITEVGR